MKLPLNMLMLLVAVLFAFALPAQAQQYQTGTLSVTNTIGTNATVSSLNLPITATKNRLVTIAPTFSLNAAGTETVIFSFARSIDGSNYETTPSVTVTNAANGTNVVRSISTVDMGAAGYLRLQSIQNNNTNASTTITNATVGYSKKVGN